jgi:hypothetical protein
MPVLSFGALDAEPLYAAQAILSGSLPYLHDVGGGAQEVEGLAPQVLEPHALHVHHRHHLSRSEGSVNEESATIHHQVSFLYLLSAEPVNE